MDSSPLSKPEPIIYGQFVVQKSVFIGLARRILTVKEDKITLDAANHDPKHHEVFNFSDILIIQFSPENDLQFTITLRKNHIITLQSEVRTECLCEIYRAWDKQISKTPGFHAAQFPSYHASKLIIPGDRQTFIETKMTVYKTYLEMSHSSLVVSSEKNQVYEKVEGAENLVESTIYIPFYQIETLYKTHVGLVLEMRDSLAKHEFIFYDLEKTNNMITRIQTNYKEFTDNFVEINDTMFHQGFTLETVAPKSYQLFFFHTKAYKVLESGHLMPIRLALSDCFLVEIDVDEELVLQKYDLASVNNIVRMVTGLAGIQVTFLDSTVVTYTVPHHHKGLLASNLFTLANWKKDTREYSLKQDFIHSMIPKDNYVVSGWINDEVELDFEIELIRRFTRAQADDQQFYNALHEFNLNARLRTYTSTDNAALKLLIQIFNKNIKVILTKEFISYWETFQTYISSRVKYESSDSSSEKLKKELTLDKQLSSSSSGTKTPEERMKILLNKFQLEIAEKFPNIRFSTKTLPLMLHRTEEVLKAITILISSKSLFKELANNKKEATLYEGFIVDVARLIDSPYPTLSHNAGCFFRALCRFSDNNEQKQESINKSFVLSSKINLMQTISAILAKRVLIKNKDQKEHENIYILSILACLRILKTFVVERKETTNPEDLQMIWGYISKPYYFAIFNFLSRYRSIACVYNTTLILNSFFKNCTSRDLYKQLQSRFINNSSLILRHIILILSSLSVLQRKISVVLLLNLFYDNAVACGLICRIFPKNLFRKVDFMSNDITKWTLQQWEQFFSLVVKDFNTTTEIWTEECRDELLTKLIKVDEDINNKFNYCPANRLQELFNDSSEEGEFLLNIRWNHEEFEIRYDFLQNKVPVGKYYLTTLLMDLEEPKLAVQIANPGRLWNDLAVKFIGTNKIGDMVMILKTMILIYKEYFVAVKDLDTMNHWLRCLRNKEYKRVWYLILQLLYTSISVDDPAVTRFNIKTFVESDGIAQLANLLSTLYFEEDHDALTEENLADYRDSPRPDMDYNYTNLNLTKQAYTPSLEKSCMIAFIINIYRSVLSRYKDKKLGRQAKFVYPIPTSKSFILEDATVKCMVNVLLLKDYELNNHMLDFFTEALCDRFTYKTLTQNSPIYEFLLYNINPRNLNSKLRFLQEVYQRIRDEDVDQEDAVRQYTAFTFKAIPEETLEEAIAQYPILKFLPKHFLYKVTRNELQDFSQIFFSQSYETPQLIWNSYMRESLANGIELHLQKYVYELVKFSESETFNRKLAPQYAVGTFDIVYDSIEDEVRCGPIFLRVWGSKPFVDFKLPADEIPIFLSKLHALLRKYLAKPLNEFSEQDFTELLIVLKAHKKAIKTYALSKYDCFGEIQTILKYLPEKISHWNPVEPSEDETLDIGDYITTLCKLIFRAIRLENSDNATNFARTKGLEVFLLILNSLVQRVTITDNGQDINNYYDDMQVSYDDLRIIGLIIRIIVKLLQKCYNELSSLSQESKVQLFMNLSKVTKIPLILFEYVRTYNQRAKSYKEVDAAKILLDKPFNKALSNIQEDENEGSVVDRYSPATTSVFNLISSQPDSSEADVCIMKIFMITKNLLDLLVECSTDVQYITTFIQAGFAWRFLEYLTYYNDIGEVSEATHNPHLQTMFINIEKICNIFRNIVMYSNEAYVWKLAGASEDNKVDVILSTKEPSSDVSRDLTKLDTQSKMVLCDFFECLVQLLGRRLVQVLLADYSQPRIVPKEHDINSINKFLKFFSTELSEPTDLWNEETRIELKNLLIDQIHRIHETNGREYLDLVKGFKYRLHQQKLVVDDVFVSQYNKSHGWWKLTDSAHFVKLCFQAVEVFRQSLITGKNPTAFLEIEVDENCLLENIEEAITAVLNAMIYNETDTNLLNEAYLTQLGSLLMDEEVQKIKSPKLTTIKARILGVCIYLTRVPAEAKKVVENAAVMKNLFVLLHSNSKESVALYPRIVKLLDRWTSEPTCRNALFNYGFYVGLFESIFKAEIFTTKQREVAYEVLVRALQTLEFAAALKKLLIRLLPVQIQQFIAVDSTALEIIEIFDNGYTNPYVLWTPLMREEVLSILGGVCDEIIKNWEGNNLKVLPLDGTVTFWDSSKEVPAPRFPEVQESLKAEGIFLSNYNKSPALEKEVNIPAFIDSIAVQINEIFDEYVKQTAKCHEYELAFKPLSDDEVLYFKNLTTKFITLYTSLLLASDQFVAERKVKEEAEQHRQRSTIRNTIETEENEMKEVSPEEEMDSSVVLNEFTMSENALNAIVRGTELFSKPMIHPHLRSTILQLLFLIAESSRGLVVLKRINIIHVLAQLLQQIADPQPQDYSLTHIEEKLVLIVLLRVVTNDESLASEALDECLKPLRAIYVGKRAYLSKYIEHIVAALSRHSERGKEAFTEFNREKEIITVAVIHDCAPNAFLQNIWRKWNKGWSAYKTQNTLNALQEQALKLSVEFPAVSDYSATYFIHAKKENKEAEQEIRAYVEKIKGEYVRSVNVEAIKDVEHENDEVSTH